MLAIAAIAIGVALGVTAFGAGFGGSGESTDGDGRYEVSGSAHLTPLLLSLVDAALVRCGTGRDVVQGARLDRILLLQRRVATDPDDTATGYQLMDELYTLGGLITLFFLLVYLVWRSSRTARRQDPPRAGGEETVLDAQVRHPVGDVVDRPVPAVDRPVVQPQLGEVRRAAGLQRRKARQDVALADAKKGIAMFGQGQMNVPIIGLVENMSYFTPAELPDNKYYIFGRDGAKNLAIGMKVPFLGQIPLVQGVREAGDAGRPAVFQENTPMAKAFDELVRTFVQEVNADKARSNVTE